jgi:hypothetical protein
MPVRRKRARSRNRRISHSVVAQLRESIARGYPWIHDAADHMPGHGELIGLVYGHWYEFALDFVDEGDDESIHALWEDLSGAIIAEHSKRRPATRPAGWWRFDAPELRRCLGRDRDDDDDDEGNGHDDGRLPAAEDPNLPEWAKGTYLGRPRVDDGYAYETQREYLERLGLLSDDEKMLLEKYGDIVFVRISSGDYGECEPCWTKAREVAKKIDFDLDPQVLPYDTFWLPEKLIFDCEHREWNRESIFTVDYL